jgi:Zn-dependent membrane protease YugP
MKKKFQESTGKDNAFWIGDPNYKRYTDKLMTSKVKGNHGTVAIGPSAGALPVVAHELGHATNNRTGAFKSRLTGALIGGGLSLASLLAYKALLFGAPSALSKKDLPTAVALGAALSGLGAVTGGAITDHSVYTEEKKASENAMEYLKSLRRTANQLKEDRETLDSALNTYKTARNWNALGMAGVAAALAGGGYLTFKHL